MAGYNDGTYVFSNISLDLSSKAKKTAKEQKHSVRKTYKYMDTCASNWEEFKKFNHLWQKKTRSPNS